MPSSQSSLVYSRTQNRLVHFSSLTAQKATLPARPPRRRPPLGARRLLAPASWRPPRAPPPAPPARPSPLPWGARSPKFPRQRERGPPQPLITHQRLTRQLARETPLLRRLPSAPAEPEARPRPRTRAPGVTPPQCHCDVRHNRHGLRPCGAATGPSMQMHAPPLSVHVTRSREHRLTRHSLSSKALTRPWSSAHTPQALCQRRPLDGPPAPPLRRFSFLRSDRKNKQQVCWRG